jgi:hypothetical protein
MLVIVEGFDNSGKTSLINYLIKDNSVEGPSVVFHSRPDIKHRERLESIARWTRLYSNGMVISDRIGIIGEEVYGKTLRGHSCFGDNIMDAWDELLWMLPEDLKVVFIWCNPKQHDMGNKQEMEGVKENKDTLQEAYRYAMENTREKFNNVAESGYDIRFIEFDYQSDPNYETLYKLMY